MRGLSEIKEMKGLKEKDVVYPSLHNSSKY
jgi:hypothetical protein